MTRALADTSLFIARESGRTLAQIELPDELAISVITVGELACWQHLTSELETCGSPR
jgi:predicted nucleic acid-binding protein